MDVTDLGMPGIGPLQAAAPYPLRLVLNWGRRYSLWVFNFGLACCAIEFISASMGRHDFIRLGVIPFAHGPRQADLMIVSGTVTDKMAPAVRRLYEQMPEPKYVISFGACSNSGGPYWDSYCVTKGVDQIIPVDVYVPGCPPRPEALLQGIVKLQEKIAGENLGRRYRRRKRGTHAVSAAAANRPLVRPDAPAAPQVSARAAAPSGTPDAPAVAQASPRVAPAGAPGSSGRRSSRPTGVEPPTAVSPTATAAGESPAAVPAPSVTPPPPAVTPPATTSSSAATAPTGLGLLWPFDQLASAAPAEPAEAAEDTADLQIAQVHDRGHAAGSTAAAADGAPLPDGDDQPLGEVEPTRPTRLPAADEPRDRP
jgi:NADH-quinone oxidoreductase subunit B